jgi:hypothetical protein
LQVIRDWVLKFNAHGPDGLVDRKAPGQPPWLNDEHRASLAAILESGPAVHGVVRWRIVDLCQWIFEELTAQQHHALHRAYQAQRHAIPLAATALVPAVKLDNDSDSDGCRAVTRTAIAAASTTDRS